MLPVRRVKFSCFDSGLSYQRLPVDNVTVPSFLLLGRLPHNAAHVICFCLPPTIVGLRTFNQWRSEGERKGRPPRAAIRRGEIWGDKGHQASHYFLGRQNCSPPRAPLTHATPLHSTISCRRRKPNRYSSEIHNTTNCFDSFIKTY